jgi:hypothetical protein
VEEILRMSTIVQQTTAFHPRDTGRLGFYVALVDDKLRVLGTHQPTVGILLDAKKNDAVVRYALASTAQPVAVSRYELAGEAQAALPDEATIVEAFSRELARGAKTD